MAGPEKIRLGDLLVREKLITQDQLEFALERQRANGHKLGRVFVESGFVSEEDISSALATQFSVPYINLKTFHIDPKLVRLLPESQARRFRAIVLAETKGKLVVGMCDPTDAAATAEIGRLVRREVEVAVVTEGQLLQSIDRGYLRTEEISGVAHGAGIKFAENAFPAFGALVESFGAEEPAVTDLLKKVFDDAMELRATDIHIEPQDKRLVVRLRIDGVLHLRPEADARFGPALASRIKLMAGLDASESRLPQSGRIHLSAHEHAVDVHVSIMPTQYGDSTVLRLRRRQGIAPGLDRLGMLPDMLARFRAIIRGKGMVLVTGPEESGKTTSIYAALGEIGALERKIITIEDPVEYLTPGIAQVQVDEKIKLGFPQALRGALLHDPDVIMLSAMPDEETAQHALRAAMTGNFVLSAMYAADAASALLSLMEMGIPRFVVVSSVRAVIAQRLLRRVCAACGEGYAPTPVESAWLRSRGVAPDQAKGLRHGRGCPQCDGSGYYGRVGVFEMLEIGRDVTEAAASSDAAQFMEAVRRQMRGKTIFDHALEQMKLGQTTVAELMRISIEPEE